MMGEWTVVTDENGVAEFEVEYDDYIATLSKAGYATSTADIQFREDHNTFTVTVRKFPLLNIHVVNEMDEPLERAYVVVSTSLDDRQEGWTDSDGNVSFARDYGTFNVAMSKSGYEITRTTVTFDSEHTDFTVVMVKESGHILKLQFHNEDGGPVRGAEITIISEAGMRYQGETSQDDGICKFDVPHGKYTFTTHWTPGYLPITDEINYTEDQTTFVYTLQYAMSFAVDKFGSLEPIPSALVVLTDESGMEYSGKSDEEGHVYIAVSEGEYDITASKNGYETFTGHETYVHDTRYHSIQLRESPGRVVLRIIALDENEEPLSGAEVKLRN